MYTKLNWKDDRRFKINPKVRDQIRKDKETLTLKEIATKHNINYWTVVGIIYPRRSKRKRKNDKKNTQRVRELRARKKKLGYYFKSRT